MHYISTRGQTAPHSFSEAVAVGLAGDRGLFLPAPLPHFSGVPAAWETLSYPQLAAEFLAGFAPEIPLAEWHSLTAEAYAHFANPEVAPLVRLSDELSVLELFHGPTLAFKDFALQLLGLLYRRQVAQSGRRLAVLGATSGDTGSAAIQGCSGQDGLTIFILYPAGRVAPLQERQMACTGAANVHAIPIPGTFDDAQAIVKEIFGDAAFAASVNLSAVNSINIARILAQCVYYVWAYLRLPVADRARAEFIVPTGNFGNILAGWLTQQMGLLPSTVKFRVATNQNDILYRFLTTGNYTAGSVQPSHAPSMDIQAASNFERYLYFLLGQDTAAVRATMADLAAGKPVTLPLSNPSLGATRMEDEQISQAIQAAYAAHQYVLDPHTACGYTALDPQRHSILLATASPAKFPEVVQAAIGIEPTHPSLEELKRKPLQTHPLPCSVAAVQDYLRAVLGQ